MALRASHKRRRYRVPKGFARDFVSVQRPRMAKRRLVVGVVFAIALHAGVVALAMMRPPESPPPPKPRELPLVVATRPPPPPPAEKPMHVPRGKAAPPAAAQTAKVLTRSDSNAPADLTDFAIVAGTSETFAGGYSAAAGSSAKAVAAPTATGGGVGPALSQARPAQPLRHDWSCGWPADAQETDLRDARVSISVSVDENGAPDQVEIVSSPGPSFAEAARECAMAERFQPALDADGHRLRAKTPHFLVHFFR